MFSLLDTSKTWRENDIELNEQIKIIIQVETFLTEFENKYNEKKLNFLHYFNQSKNKNTDFHKLITYFKSIESVPFYKCKNINLTTSETERTISSHNDIITTKRNGLDQTPQNLKTKSSSHTRF